MFWRRKTGRSDVLAPKGIVAASEPLAAQAGIEILRQGGNAADAAVATAAVLDVTEPFSTGCGGDAFVLLHTPDGHRPIALNGSGRAGSLVTLDELLSDGWEKMPVRGGPPVTVPGAMHLWELLNKEYGNLDLGEVLAPAIRYARDGFPVAPIISQYWKMLVPVLQNDEAQRVFTIDGRAPQMGDLMRNKDLAHTFETVANEGAETFYEGDIADAIVKTVQAHGGFLTHEDLKRHRTEKTDPISSEYHGLRVFEHPPNGQGFAALIMLNILTELEISRFGPLESKRYHLMIEAKKLAYADLLAHNADPYFYDVPLEKLLSKGYAKQRAKRINEASAMEPSITGALPRSDTIYLATADAEGMAVSFINSLYMGFGSGLVVPGTGIKLQNRGNLFSLDPKHPNAYAPGKRPFHTIIPGALYREHEFYGVFGIMGGSHQAQAHVQFVSNLVDYNMTPQEALDHPRFHHDQETNMVALENGIPPYIQGELRRLGHRLHHETMVSFGGGQAIIRLDNAWIGGSDHRKDGQAIGF
ncbi:MAG: gamma-glutamyltransferase [Candidatus Thorarchaeota archaeon]|nr:gamma-glutamyltransferase [Candidatus Thorarchaeota archaeon]